VRHQHQRRAFFERHADAGKRGADTRVVSDLAVFHRHVEVFADQHSLIGERQVCHLDDGHTVFGN
jgi:hypothetical protein